VPTDPETEQSYEYRVKSASEPSFELCTTFNLEQKGQGQMQPKTPYPVDGGLFQNWDHPAGRYCFERKIDKELYPPFSKQ